jgi:hypothetical protein
MFLETFQFHKGRKLLVPSAVKFRIPEESDLRNFNVGQGVQRALRYVSPRGMRQDVVSQCILPLLWDK